MISRQTIHTIVLSAGIAGFLSGNAQKTEMVKMLKEKDANRINVSIGGKPFTSFFYPDTLEKPVLYPISAANGTRVSRGFPLNPLPGEPTDHPHHIGMWLNYENVNGLDFWNNSFAIPAEKKKAYGWIKTVGNPETKDGTTG